MLDHRRGTIGCKKYQIGHFPHQAFFLLVTTQGNSHYTVKFMPTCYRMLNVAEYVFFFVLFLGLYVFSLFVS